MRARIAVIWGLTTAAVAAVVGFAAYNAGLAASGMHAGSGGLVYRGYFGFGFFPFFGLFWLLLIGLLLLGLFRRPWGRGPWGYGPGYGFREWHRQAHAEGLAGTTGQTPSSQSTTPSGGPVNP
jgi:hypothetical protein